MTRGRILTLVIFVAVTAVGLTALMAAKDVNEKPDSPAKTVVSGKKLVCLGNVETEYPGVRIFPDNWPLPSKVTKVLAKEGDEVKAGQQLLELDAEMPKLRVREAAAAVAEAEAAKGKATAMVKGYQPQVDALRKKLQARREGLEGAKFGLAELERAFKHNLVSQAQVDEGKSKVKEAQLNIDSAEEELTGLEKVGSPGYLEAQADKAIERLRITQEQAALVLAQCSCTAPADGRILSSDVSEGLMFGPQTREPAFLFLKKGPLIVRAAVSQEFAKRVIKGGAAKIEDEADITQTWKGRVFKVGDQFLPKRNTGGTMDLLTVSDERVLECLISIDVAADATPPKYGQKVRVTLGE